jgi:N-acetylmuramoyl-L-alanine amidase
MNIIKDFIAKGRPNRSGDPNLMKYITIHNTDNVSKGANAKSHANYLKTTNAKVSWHYSVDEDNVYQHLPDSEEAYHTANTLGNNQSIGIEICVNSDGDLKKATDNAIELVKILIKKYNIPTYNIKQHFYWSGKNCPSFIRAGKPYNWTKFIEKVEDNIVTYDEAVKILQDSKIMNTPTYWEHARVCVKNFEELMINCAEYIEKNK